MEEVTAAPETKSSHSAASPTLSREEKDAKAEQEGRKAPRNVNDLFTLKIDNCSSAITSDLIREIFAPFGEIGDVYIPRRPDSNDPKGFAFVRFVEHSSVTNAQSELDGKALAGKPMVLSEAKQRRPDNPQQLMISRSGSSSNSHSSHSSRSSHRGQHTRHAESNGSARDRWDYDSARSHSSDRGREGGRWSSQHSIPYPSAIPHGHRPSLHPAVVDPFAPLLHAPPPGYKMVYVPVDEGSRAPFYSSSAPPVYRGGGHGVYAELHPAYEEAHPSNRHSRYSRDARHRSRSRSRSRSSSRSRHRSRHRSRSPRPSTQQHPSSSSSSSSNGASGRDRDRDAQRR